MVLISFYTDNWLYPEHAERLRAECEHYRLEHDIRRLDAAGEWIDNTRLKAGFIRDRLREHREVAWVDVDSRLLRKPDVFKRSLGAEVGLLPHTTMPRHWHVGVMTFHRCPRVLALLDVWIDQCRAGGTDEAAFERAWLAAGQGVGVRLLPGEYHALPVRGEWPSGSVIGMGLSLDESKLAAKRRRASAC